MLNELTSALTWNNPTVGPRRKEKGVSLKRHALKLAPLVVTLELEPSSELHLKYLAARVCVVHEDISCCIANLQKI